MRSVGSVDGGTKRTATVECAATRWQGAFVLVKWLGTWCLLKNGWSLSKFQMSSNVGRWIQFEIGDQFLGRVQIWAWTLGDLSAIEWLGRLEVGGRRTSSGTHWQMRCLCEASPLTCCSGCTKWDGCPHWSCCCWRGAKCGR